MPLLVRSAGSSQALTASLRDLVCAVDSDQPILSLLASFVGGMGLPGLVLALSGIYAVMAWSATRRTREIGIRMAVGADQGSVVGLILK